MRKGSTNEENTPSARLRRPPRLVHQAGRFIALCNADRCRQWSRDPVVTLQRGDVSLGYLMQSHSMR